MNPVRIKFCGVTRREDALAASELGVDAIGLNLARGPRRISVEQARELTVVFPPFVTAVALFVDADEATILEAMRVSRCQAVQLHGQESAELSAKLRARFPVIKAFAVTDEKSLAVAREFPADALLLDTPMGGTIGSASSGGSGQSWDYALLNNAVFDKPILLAGGLRPDNVRAAIARIQPWGVDVSSGIESAPGIKNTAAMKAFIAAVRAS